MDLRKTEKKNTYRDTDDTYKTVFIKCVDFFNVYDYLICFWFYIIGWNSCFRCCSLVINAPSSGHPDKLELNFGLSSWFETALLPPGFFLAVKTGNVLWAYKESWIIIEKQKSFHNYPPMFVRIWCPPSLCDKSVARWRCCHSNRIGNEHKQRLYS